MGYVLITFGVIVALVILVFILLVINVRLGCSRQKKRACAKLAPVLDPLDAGGRPDPADVRRLAADPETRNSLYDAMAERGQQGPLPRRLPHAPGVRRVEHGVLARPP